MRLAPRFFPSPFPSLPKPFNSEPAVGATREPAGRSLQRGSRRRRLSSLGGAAQPPPGLGTDPGLTSPAPAPSASARILRTAFSAARRPGRLRLGSFVRAPGLQAGLGTGKVPFPRGVGVSWGEDSDSPCRRRVGPERLLRARAPRWKSGASPAGQVQNFPSQARESGPLEPRAGDGDRLLPSYLREAAVGPRKLWTTGLTPAPHCLQTRFETPAVTRCAPRSSRTRSPQPPQAPCELCRGPRRCALAFVGRAVRAERRPRRLSRLSHLHLFKARLVVRDLWNANCGPGLLRHLH